MARDHMLDPRVELLTASGALDLQTQRQLQSQLSDTAGDRSRELLIDLRGVTCLDSSLLAILVHTDQHFRRRGRAMACVTRRGPVEEFSRRPAYATRSRLFAAPEEAPAYVLGARGQRPPGGASAHRAAPRQVPYGSDAPPR